MIASHYEFYNPSKLISGNKTVDQLTYELAMEESSRPIIITGKICTGKGIVKKIINALGGTDIIIGGIYDNAGAAPDADMMREIIGVYRENSCDAVVAAGGMAVLDVAGRIRGEISFEIESNSGLVRSVPYYAIPTDAIGAFYAGSSANAADPDINSYRPDIVVLDPEMMAPSGRSVTAEGAAAAFASSIETALDGACGPVARAFAYASVKGFSGNLFRAVKKYKNREYIFGVANAAVQAGFASSNNSGGIIFSVSKLLSGLCAVPAGVICGILLPHYLDNKLKTSEEALAKLLPPLAGNDIFAETPAEKRAGASVKIVKDIISSVFDECRMPKTLSGAGVGKEKLEAALEAVLKEKKHENSEGNDLLVDTLNRAY